MEQELNIEDYQRIFFDTNFLYIGNDFWINYIQKIRSSDAHIRFSDINFSNIDGLAMKYSQLISFFKNHKEKVKLVPCLEEEIDNYIAGRLRIIGEREHEYLFTKLSFGPGDTIVRADKNCEKLIQIKESLKEFNELKKEIIYEPDNQFLKVIKNYVSTLSRLPVEFATKSKDKYFTPGRATDEELVENVLSDVLKNKSKTCFISNDRYVQNLLYACFHFLTKPDLLVKHYWCNKNENMTLDVIWKSEDEKDIRLTKIESPIVKALEEDTNKNEIFTSITNVVFETYKKLKKLKGE